MQTHATLLCVCVCSYTDPQVSMDLLRAVLQPSFNEDIMAVFKKYQKVRGHLSISIHLKNVQLASHYVRPLYLNRKNSQCNIFLRGLVGNQMWECRDRCGQMCVNVLLFFSPSSLRKRQRTWRKTSVRAFRPISWSERLPGTFWNMWGHFLWSWYTAGRATPAVLTCLSTSGCHMTGKGWWWCGGSDLMTFDFRSVW